MFSEFLSQYFDCIVFVCLVFCFYVFILFFVVFLSLFWLYIKAVVMLSLHVNK